MSLTLTDLFCGAGGSSLGATSVGIELRMAANHWKLAVETHATNFAAADHDVADISQTDPRRYPATDLLWASPECTNHSKAKGIRRADAQPDLFGEDLPDEAAERSRATMWDVPRFVEAKLLAGRPYAAFVVENVLDVRDWMYHRSWRMALSDAGYCLHEVNLNSMHAAQAGLPAPQSRDRWYCVGHQSTMRCPDLDRWTQPYAWCPSCDQQVRVMRSWKRPDRPWGRYRSQYVYRCPHTSCRNSVLEPAWLPAACAIDWSLPGQRIGDRTSPLAQNTRARIEAGLERYARGVYPQAGRNTVEWLINDASHPTASTVVQDALMVPVEGHARPARQPLATLTAGRNPHALLVPSGGTWNEDARPDTEPFRTRTTRENEGVAFLPAWSATYGYDTGQVRSTGDVLPTQTTVQGDALLTGSGLPDVEDCHFRMLQPHEIQAAMAFAASYDVLGNKKERVRQLGNAVTPPAARDLLSALTEVIT